MEIKDDEISNLAHVVAHEYARDVDSAEFSPQEFGKNAGIVYKAVIAEITSADTPKTGALEAAKGRLVKAFVDGKDAPVAKRQESDMDSGEMSFGEKAVGLMFNPAGNEQVTSIKRKFADVIDDLEAIRNGSDCGELKRLASTAIAQAEYAHFWAIKAVTFAK